jgi:hypothetical protein
MLHSQGSDLRHFTYEPLYEFVRGNDQQEEAGASCSALDDKLSTDRWRVLGRD